MPVRIRLAKNGQRKNSRTSMLPPVCGREALTRSGKRLGQQRYIVIEQLEIVGNYLLAAHRRQQDDHLACGFARYGVRGLQVEVRLDQDQLYPFALHQLNQLDSVRGAGRNRRPGDRSEEHTSELQSLA